VTKKNQSEQIHENEDFIKHLKKLN